METVYDALVVGCGPAGSTAGYLLASAGLNVAMFDKCTFPRHKLCGGLLPEKTVRIVERIFDVTRDELMGTGVIDHVSDKYTIYYHDAPVVQGVTPRPFYHVDRAAYDGFLLGKAVSRGARLHEAEIVLGVDPRRGFIETRSGRRYCGRFIVGSDGALGVTKRYVHAGSRGRHTRPRTASAIEAEIPFSELRRPLTQPAVIVGHMRLGYGWVFPTGKGVVAGLGGIRQKGEKSLKEIFDTMIAGLRLADPDSLKVRGHPIPFGNLRRRPVAGCLLLAGDAAGFADPITGEGVYHAHLSGEAASAAVLCAVRGLGLVEDVYPDLLGRTVIPLLAGARRFQIVAYTALGVLPPVLAKAIVRRFHARALEVVNGMAGYPLSRCVLRK